MRFVSRRLTFRALSPSGAGLVEASEPETELEETVNKVRGRLVAVKAGAP